MRKSMLSGLAIMLILALTSCLSPSESNSQVEPSTTRTPEVVEKIYSDTLLRKMKAHFESLVETRDDVEGTSSYRSSSSPRDGIAERGVDVFATIYQQDGSGPRLRLRVQYMASDWIFFEEVVVNVDGENTRFSPGYSAVSRRSSSGVVYEWWSAQLDDTELLNSIGYSEKTIVRLAGDTSKTDTELSVADQLDMVRVASAYEWLLYEYNNEN
jgi:hypothetical protein